MILSFDDSTASCTIDGGHRCGPSAFLAVVLNEASETRSFGALPGADRSPEILPYDVGNALVRRAEEGRLTDHEVLRACSATAHIAVTLLPVAIPSAVKLAMQFRHLLVRCV